MLFYPLVRRLHETPTTSYFTEEFKKEAVRLFKQQDLTLAEVSRNLDITPKSLKTWLALYDAGTLKASIGVAKLTPD